MADTPRFNEPVSGMVVPRFAGIATFMRLPHVAPVQADDIDIGIIGVPFDGGTTNRPGPRHGPRQVRDMSQMVRRSNPALRITPYELANVADLGDAEVNPADLMDSLAKLEAFYARLVEKNVLPLSCGGDHLISYPILRAVGAKRPVGMIHFDAHTDLNDTYFGGFKITHGTPFRRAIEDGVLDPKRTVQIGIRGSAYDYEDRDYAASVGVRIITMEEFNDLGVARTMEIARAVAGDGPTYVSFDIDAMDPVYAPGTGTPEVCGFTNREAIQMVRLLRGLNFAGADMVEVSPPFDPSGYTAYNGANVMWELLCLMAEHVGKVR
ncbi:MAG: agmatinase [Aestuariivirgaceae bacterium]|nr:agmatinase [Aestuariivirgaceae bacterium]